LSNIEYSDVHKFLVSVGLSVIAVAFTLPWLFLREKFDLYVTQVDIEQLPLQAQKVIQYKISVLQMVMTSLPYLSVLLFIAGVIFISLGARFWWEKQKQIDRHQVLVNENQELANKKLKRELETTTPKEKVSKILKDCDKQAIGAYAANLSEKQNESAVYEDSVNDADILKNYFDMEQNIIDKLKSRYNTEYDMVLNKKIADIPYDILLLSKERNKEDMILDVKYRVTSPLSKKEMTSQLELMEKIYRLATGRQAQSFIIIVAADAIKQHAEKIIQSYVADRKAVVLAESEVDGWDAEI
jgi:hypothetical protein